MLYPNLAVNEQGHLTFAGMDTLALAQQFGTPLYLLDEARVRHNCRVYRQGMQRIFGADALPLYASKALSCRALYTIMHQEGMGVDVVSCGEIHTALCGGFPGENMYFHGTNKTDADMRYAMEKGVGYFVVDSPTELLALNEVAGEMGVRQKILLRLTCGIDAHTFEAVNTGRLDCQFGVPIPTGQALEFTRMALALPHVCLVGFHSHIGSQIFTAQPFCDAADIILDFLVQLRRELNYLPAQLDLGGGFGVPYVQGQPTVDVAALLEEFGTYLKAAFAAKEQPLPALRMEPGRSIVADAGITLYTAGVFKDMGGIKQYVTVDGGMSDNPRYALYQAPYTVVSAGRMHEAADTLCTVAGRCCESGALIQEDVHLPHPRRGDILAVLGTGAYNYSMASNYNRLPRPAMVLVGEGGARLIIRRESLEDLTRNDLAL